MRHATFAELDSLALKRYIYSHSMLAVSGKPQPSILSDQHTSVLSSYQSWVMVFFSQVPREQEVCTVMRSLSSVIQFELFSGSLPTEIRREEKRPAEYLTHLI